MTRAELTRMKSLITDSEMDSWFGIIPGEELDLLLNKARTFLGKWGKLWNRWMSKNHLKILLAIIQSKKFDFEVMINEVDINGTGTIRSAGQAVSPTRSGTGQRKQPESLPGLGSEAAAQPSRIRVLKEVVYQIPETYRDMT